VIPIAWTALRPCQLPVWFGRILRLDHVRTPSRAAPLELARGLERPIRRGRAVSRVMCADSTHGPLRTAEGTGGARPKRTAEVTARAARGTPVARTSTPTRSRQSADRRVKASSQVASQRPGFARAAAGAAARTTAAAGLTAWPSSSNTTSGWAPAVASTKVRSAARRDGRRSQRTSANFAAKRACVARRPRNAARLPSPATSDPPTFQSGARCSASMQAHSQRKGPRFGDSAGAADTSPVRDTRCASSLEPWTWGAARMEFTGSQSRLSCVTCPEKPSESTRVSADSGGTPSHGVASPSSKVVGARRASTYEVTAQRPRWLIPHGLFPHGLVPHGLVPHGLVPHRSSALPHARSAPIRRLARLAPAWLAVAPLLGQDPPQVTPEPLALEPRWRPWS
jgi:hypothetical protein